MNSKSHSTFKPRSLRKLESKNRQRIIWSLVISIALIYFALNWGLQAFVGTLSLFSRDSLSKNKQITEETKLTPPVLNIPFEATNTATISFTGYSMPQSIVEIYIDDEKKIQVDTRDDGSFEITNLELSLGINNIYGKTTNSESNEQSKSLPSKNIKVIYSNEKPKLELSEPEDGKTITGGDKKVKIAGSTDPDNIVTVNGQVVILNNAGQFGLNYDLNEGENTIIISSTNKVGSTTEIQRKVTYQP